jgi:hypothetical protein
VTGIAEALTTDGGKLSIKDKSGLGYTGEKIERNPNKRFASSNRQQQGDIRITTVYDNPEETDPAEPHNRRWEPTRNKNRSRQIKNVFVKP